MLVNVTSSKLRWISATALVVAALVLGASSAAAQTASPGEPEKARSTTLDVAGMDTGAEACTDFYRYANPGWLAAHPIPSDRPRWGTFDELRQRNQTDLRGILCRGREGDTCRSLRGYSSAAPARRWCATRGARSGELAPQQSRSGRST